MARLDRVLCCADVRILLRDLDLWTRDKAPSMRGSGVFEAGGNGKACNSLPQRPHLLTSTVEVKVAPQEAQWKVRVAWFPEEGADVGRLEEGGICAGEAKDVRLPSREAHHLPRVQFPLTMETTVSTIIIAIEAASDSALLLVPQPRDSDCSQMVDILEDLLTRA